MKPTTWMVLCGMAVALIALPPTALADDGGVPGAAPAERTDEASLGLRRMKATIDGITKAVGKVRLTEADVKSLLKHAKSFHAVGKMDGEEDDAIETALDAHFEKTGVYDIELIYGVPALKAWASTTQVDARHWVPRFLRATSLKIRDEIQASSKEMLETMPGQLAQIEAMREQMGEAAFAQAKQGIERALGMARTMDAVAKTIPAATPEEARLLAAYGKQLDAALDDDDDSDDDDSDDDDSDDDDSEDDDSSDDDSSDDD